MSSALPVMTKVQAAEALRAAGGFCPHCGRPKVLETYKASHDQKTGEPVLRWVARCKILTGLLGGLHRDDDGTDHYEQVLGTVA